MSEREKEALDTIKKAYPEMSEFTKGYILGVCESRLEEKKKRTANQAEVELAG